MDGLLEKIVELAKDAEHLKRTCRCEHGTPTRSNKKAKRNGHNGTPASPERQSTDIIASSPFNFRGHKVFVFLNLYLPDDSQHVVYPCQGRGE